MSDARRNRRKRERTESGHLNKLATLLSEFYEFLSSDVQPSNEEVRSKFIEQKEAWYKYCSSRKLNNQAKDLFVMNVEKTWRHKTIKTAVQ